MPPVERYVFIPWGTLNGDGSEFLNEGLRRATNVVPVGETYVPSAIWEDRTNSDLAAEPRGFYVHATDGQNLWRGYLGTDTDLYEVSNVSSTPWTVTNKTRTVGGVYGAPATDSGWQGASFGDAVIMTNYSNAVQILTSPTASNFENMIQSGGANPGMDPKAKFVFPVKINLFIANLNLSTGFDGLSAGANPTLVACSQNDNPRQFGSANETPQLTGATYQPLNFDLGHITGAVGGSYGLVAMQRGWVRIEGPPYSYTPMSEGIGCIYPNSICRFDNDVYFWGANGPMVFRDGQGSAIPLARDAMSRSILDDSFDLDGGYAIMQGLSTPLTVSATACFLTRTIWFTYISGYEDLPPRYETTILVYDVDNNRFSAIKPITQSGTADRIETKFMKSRPQTMAPTFPGNNWAPGRDIVGIRALWSGGLATFRPAGPIAGEIPTDVRFTTSFKQLNERLTTRITKVRPVFGTKVQLDLPSVSVSVNSRNKTYGPVYTSTYDTLGSHGWITTPGTRFADMHEIDATLSVESWAIRQLAGIVVAYITGGEYAE